ncbi:TPA: DivIVA domain-containing protein [Streptococcus suis]
MRKTLFGYRPREVEEKLALLDKEICELRNKNAAQEQTIAEMKDKLKQAEKDEEVIKETIIDAKHLSKRLVREAKEQAADMLQDAEKQIQEQFAQFAITMATLTDLKNKVIAQKNELTKELNDTLYRYTTVLKQDESNSFDAIVDDMESSIQETEKIVENTKKIIFLPKMDDNKGDEVAVLGLNDDIPVYSFH